MIYPALKLEKTIEWWGDGEWSNNKGGRRKKKKKKDWTGSLCFEYHGEKYTFYF